MSTLSDDLARLTAAQPAQPGDRLAAVTGRARRMRQRRAAVTAVAVLAVGAPVALAVTHDPATRTVDYASSPATWPERSPRGDTTVAQGALLQRAEQSQTATGDVRWLYRGQVDVPGGSPLYVVAFTADDRIVMGFGALGKPDDSHVDELTAGKGWQLQETALAQAPAVLSLYLPRLDAGGPPDNWLFALAAPPARELSYDVTALPFAPPAATTSGALRSDDGVFQGWTGLVNGRLTATVGDVRVPLSFPDADPQLVPVADPPTIGTETGIAGGSGQLDEDSSSIGYSNDSAQGSAVLRMRCYGGGRVTVHVDQSAGGTSSGERAVGTAACDDQLHEVTLGTANGRRYLRLQGDRQQVYAFALDRVQG